MHSLVDLADHEDIAVITIDNPPVNALSHHVAEGLVAALRGAEGRSYIRAIVLIGAGKTFIAGADIHELSRIVTGERTLLDLNTYLNALENCCKPVVAAIHGTALGGGLETAMAAHYRIMTPDALAGMPEVKLGLIPGAGGTQRLPRLVGPAEALRLCTTGESINAAAAIRLGLADEIIEGDLLDGAIRFARDAAGRDIPKTRKRMDKLAEVPSQLFETARAQSRIAARGSMAPMAAIEAIEAAVQLPFAEGLEKEAKLFDQCLHSPQCKALIHVFFGERTVAKIPGIGKSVKPRAIRQAAVVGAGTMGSGIAMTYANAGVPVRLKESSPEALDRGLAVIRKNYENSVAKGKLTNETVEKRLALISPQLDYEGFDQVDIVTEAVFENMAVKKTIFAELDAITNSDCILATNTSSLDVDEIASSTTCPQSVAGTHFFSPANVMRLLEVVRGKETSQEVLASAMALGKKLGKVAVLAGNSYGFIGNRMLGPYLREAHFLVEEGASVEQVNHVLQDFGMAMGPLAVDDLSGLDILEAVRKEFERFEKPQVRQPLVPRRLVQLGFFGQKTGRGWSRYGADRKPIADPEVAKLIEEAAAEAGITRRQIANEEILDRCLFALISEGARILEEGVALRPVDIDITYVYGYGFPAWRGGPMFYADTLGLSSVLTRLREFEKQHGPDLWSPAPLLVRLAQENGSFASFDSAKTAEA